MYLNGVNIDNISSGSFQVEWDPAVNLDVLSAVIGYDIQIQWV